MSKEQRSTLIKGMRQENFKRRDRRAALKKDSLICGLSHLIDGQNHYVAESLKKHQ
jgi:hypothetical protein